MSVPHVLLTRREEFCASHRLHSPELSDEENRRVFGVCNNPNGHGHNYEIEVTVAGPVSSRTGMVINLTDLSRVLLETVIAEVDHKHLNHDVPFLEGIVPTAENLAVAFWGRLERELEGLEPACRLHRIRLFENRSSFVDYAGPATGTSPSSSASS